MQGFKQRFTRIKDLSDRRRLPLLGRIRLGVKMISKNTGKEYPKETSWFVVPPEVAQKYGDQPTELDIMFPINDPEVIFPQKLIWYGESKGAKCMGDGTNALRLNEETKSFEDRECPCEMLDHGCNKQAYLLFMLPEIAMGGVYMISLGSYHSIVDINSSLDYIQALVGRFAMVPIKLKREPRQTHGSGRRVTHYTLKLVLEGDINFINSLRESTGRILAGPRYALPAPVVENPAMDTGAVVEVEEDEPERAADVGETPTVPPPPEESPTETPTESPTESPTPPGMTMEEVQVDLEERGMVKKPEPAQDDKTGEAKLLNAYAKEIAKMPDAKAVNTWFSTNCLPLKKEFSEDAYWQLTKLVNDKLRSFKKK